MPRSGPNPSRSPSLPMVARGSFRCGRVVPPPDGAEAAVMIERAHVGMLAAPAESPRRTRRDGHGVTAARGLVPSRSCALDDPYVAVADDVVARTRHDVLLRRGLAPRHQRDA